MSQQDTSAIILAGGKSTRLGRDKASELLLGVSMLQHVVGRVEAVAGEIIVVCAAGQTLPEVETSTRLRVVQDIDPEGGPLGGVFSGLSAISAPRAVIVGCDMPLLQPALLTALLGLQTDEVDAVVPTNAIFLPEPLCAVYSKRCLPGIEKQLASGMLKVALLLDRVRTRYVPPAEWRAWDPDGLSFLNVNRDADVQRAEALLRD